MPLFTIRQDQGENRVIHRCGYQGMYNYLKELGYRLDKGEFGICYDEETGRVSAVYVGNGEDASSDTQIWPSVVEGRYKTYLLLPDDEGYVPDVTDLAFDTQMASSITNPESYYSVQPKNNVSYTDPTSSNNKNEGYLPTSIWVNYQTNSLYICLSSTETSADWLCISEPSLALSISSQVPQNDTITLTPGVVTNVPDSVSRDTNIVISSGNTFQYEMYFSVASEGLSITWNGYSLTSKPSDNDVYFTSSTMNRWDANGWPQFIPDKEYHVLITKLNGKILVTIECYSPDIV